MKTYQPNETANVSTETPKKHMDISRIRRLERKTRSNKNKTNNSHLTRSTKNWSTRNWVLHPRLQDRGSSGASCTDQMKIPIWNLKFNLGNILESRIQPRSLHSTAKANPLISIYFNPTFNIVQLTIFEIVFAPINPCRRGASAIKQYRVPEHA